MKAIFLCLWALAALPPVATAQENPGWHQWGRVAQHHGMAPVAGAGTDLADLVYDPFVRQERAEQFGVLAGHYQVPLVGGRDDFMEGA